jgi:hypothetical protein
MAQGRIWSSDFDQLLRKAVSERMHNIAGITMSPNEADVVFSSADYNCARATCEFKINIAFFRNPGWLLSELAAAIVPPYGFGKLLCLFEKPWICQRAFLLLPDWLSASMFLHATFKQSLTPALAYD